MNALVTEIKDPIEIRHYLHQHPELSDKEFETTKFITNYLQKLGYKIVTPKDLNTGVIAEIGNGNGPVIGLRSDIDALPIQEKTGLQYSSISNGVMHACGHDFHMASLLGAAAKISNQKDSIKGTIRLVFQPAEETHVGAQEVKEAGGVDNLDAIIGFHNKPDYGVGEVGITAGGLMAAVDQFTVSFQGVGTHAAMPNLGNDPIVALTTTVNTLQTIVSRNENPQQTAVLSVTHVQGGATWNVIPESAWFEGTLRTFTHEARATAKKRFFEIVNGEAAAFGLEAEINWQEGPDVVNNDSNLTKVVEEESAKFLRVIKPVPSNAGEDFAYFSQRIPSVFVFFGSHGNTDWHHDDLVLDDAGLKYAIEWYYRIGFKLLEYLRK
ncbi:amidohydrolase [Paucilactobacillus nenjiangensis]|uniref:amidohydrolase n=1 Tax=Paucilactobacillus nenjiangensis TaxID=1296540 RepID=UPI0010FA1425